MPDVLAKIQGQIDQAAKELREYAPNAIDWYARSRAAADQLAPWLVDVAAGLRGSLNEVLASPTLVRDTWERIKTEGSIAADLTAEMDASLANEQVLVSKPSGALISKLIERYLIHHFPTDDLESNGASDYPDLFVRSYDYAEVPSHTRDAVKFGAAIKGGRPVRVPDGIEIKTVGVGKGIDCHYPHVGLHLIVEYDAKDQPIHVTDIRLGFARRDTYAIANRRTEATTVKASFRRSTIQSSAFVSILPTGEELF